MRMSASAAAATEHNERRPIDDRTKRDSVAGCRIGHAALVLGRDGHEPVRATSEGGMMCRRPARVGMRAGAASGSGHAACWLPSRPAAKEATAPHGQRPGSPGRRNPTGRSRSICCAGSGATDASAAWHESTGHARLTRDAPPRLQQCRSFASASSHRTPAWPQHDRDR